MGTVTVSLPADGSTGTVSQYNTPITTVVNEMNGNLDNANIKSSAAIATSKLASDNGITAGMIGSSAITLGYAQITTTFTTTATTATLVTGLSATVTIPTGSRKIKITAWGQDIYNSVSNSQSKLSIWDGTVGSGTQLTEAVFVAASNFQAAPVIAIAVVTPAAGSKTYSVGLRASANTAGFECSATSPAFLLVEAI